MKKIHVGVAFGFYAVSLLALIFWATDHGFRQKWAAQTSDRNILISADYDDISYFKIKTSPLEVLMVPNRISVAEEAAFRKRGLTLVWKLWDDLDWDDFSRRFQPGDGMILSGDELINKPFFPTALASLVREKNGFVVMAEFSPIKSSKTFYRSCPPGSLVKGHIVGTRETSVPKPELWRARVQRAAAERWIRFFSVRFSPAWSVDQNIDFQNQILSDFANKGFTVSKTHSPGSFFKTPHSSMKTRSLAILVISVLTPLFVVLLIRTFPLPSALLAFFLASALSVVSGVAIHALGSTPDMILGVAPLRGVKFQLVAPLLFGLFFLLSQKERNNVMDSNIQVKHLVWGGLGLFILVFLYLSRSGNHPLIAVSEGERGLRDAMESLFGARPRFKEFLFAHPLFIWGLLHFKQDFFKGRFFIWLGLIGQISILNTFAHFHTPIEQALLRSFHGCWLGALIALPFCMLYRRMSRT